MIRSLWPFPVSAMLWCIAVMSFSTTAEAEANDSTCEYSSSFPESFAPWTALIRPLPRQTFVGVIINNTTILATGQAFRQKQLKSKFVIFPFANYTIQIGAHFSDHKAFVQIGNVSYIKPHPKVPTKANSWPAFEHDWVLIYLKEPIQFIKGFGPACLPSEALIRDLTFSKEKTVANLSDVLIHGTVELRVTQTSYLIKLKDYVGCHRLWKDDPVTKRFGYRSRVCGPITRPNTNKTCIARDSAGVIEQNGKRIIIGFQNLRRKSTVKTCNESSLIYVSLLTLEDLEWVQADMKCGHKKFSCDNGTKCLDLKTVCDGKTHQCDDGTDQNSNYCGAISACEANQFTCSRGLAEYCIPAIDSQTGRVAKNCNRVEDCPNGEDEDAELCASKFPIIWIYIGVGACALFVSSLVIAFGLRSRRNLRDLTEEELIDFFEGERHLQLEGGVEMEETSVGTANEENMQQDGTPKYQNIEVGPYIEFDRLTRPSLDSAVDFCPEVVRRRGYEKSLEFIVQDPSQCTFGPQIGKGSFGIIKKGFIHGKPAAIKFPNLSIQVNAFKVLLLELKILKYIHDSAGDTGHPNIVGFLGADTQRVRQRMLYVALEFCENGNIQDYIAWNRAHFKTNICGPSLTALQVDQSISSKYSSVVVQEMPLPTPYPLHSDCLQRLIRWAVQIASGMKFLSHKIVHLDLATRNVLLDSNLVAKVGDFGLSRKVYENITYKIERKDPLPFQWLALEVLTTLKCSLNSDVWSYGVTIWELFSLCDEPWESVRDPRELATKLSNGHRLDIPNYSSDEIYQQMLRCWHEKPGKRPSFGELETFFENLLRGV